MSVAWVIIAFNINIKHTVKCQMMELLAANPRVDHEFSSSAGDEETSCHDVVMWQQLNFGKFSVDWTVWVFNKK